MKNIIGLPQFKYHPNLYLSDMVTFETNVCNCCGKKVHAYISHMHTRFKVTCICLDCVASGKAAEKFDGYFNEDDSPVKSPEKNDELCKRTPGYYSWQQEKWLNCCNDHCAYLGRVGKADLDDLGIYQEVVAECEKREVWVNELIDDMTPDGWVNGHLFQCLHCGKYHLHVDVN